MSLMKSMTRILSLAALAALTAAPLTARAADLKVTARYDGDPPRPQAIKFGADPKCAAMHDRPKRAEDMLINPKAENAILNVFAYIKSGPSVDGKEFEVPAEPVTLDQQGCLYRPHVQGMIAGQSLEIVNSDETLHNVHCMAEVNPEFNFAQPTPGTKEVDKLRRPEKAVKFKCDVHPWMSAYVFVMEHPFFDVTGVSGDAAIENLEPGTYTLAAWHEQLGEQEVQVEVTEDGPNEVEFLFSK